MIYNCVKCGNKTNRNRKETKFCNKCYESILVENFYELTHSKENLLIDTFNKVSKFSTKSYVLFFKNKYNIKNWYELICIFGKNNDLIDFVCLEYLIWSDKTKEDSVVKFYTQYPINITSACLHIGINNIRKYCDRQEIIRSDTDNVMFEYIRIKKLIQDVPSYTEFFENSYFTQNVINSKFGGYKKFISSCFKEDLPRYLERRKSIKNKICYTTFKGRYQITNEQLIENFDNCFKGYIEKFNCLPSSKELQRQYPVDLKHIKQRTGLNYLQLVSRHGYDESDLKSYNKSERSCLNNIADLLSSHYEPQKTFPWLRGCKDYPLFCDAYFPEFNLIVEFNGVQHYKPISKFGGEESFKVVQQNDAIKEKLCKEHGLHFVTIKSISKWHDQVWLVKHFVKHGFTFEKVTTPLHNS